MDILAIVPIRNDAPYVANCLRSLSTEGLSVAVIDNESTDELVDILGRPQFRQHVVDYSVLPFRGAYEQVRVWEAVDRVAERLRPDWFVYVDVDEVLHSYDEGQSVADVLRAADASGCNAVNLDEFVFLPLDNDYVPDLDDWQPILHYYFFEPRPSRLMRARRFGAGFSLAEFSTHRIHHARVRLFPESLAMRHYIFRSSAHARTKYPQRRHLDEELRRGWNVNRDGYGPDAFAFPPASRLMCLANPGDRRLDRSDPWSRHYWERSRSVVARVRHRLRGSARRG